MQEKGFLKTIAGYTGAMGTKIILDEVEINVILSPNGLYRCLVNGSTGQFSFAPEADGGIALSGCWIDLPFNSLQISTGNTNTVGGIIEMIYYKYD